MKVPLVLLAALINMCMVTEKSSADYTSARFERCERFANPESFRRFRQLVLSFGASGVIATADRKVSAVNFLKRMCEAYSDNSLLLKRKLALLEETKVVSTQLIDSLSSISHHAFQYILTAAEAVQDERAGESAKLSVCEYRIIRSHLNGSSNQKTPAAPALLDLQRQAVKDGLCSKEETKDFMAFVGMRELTPWFGEPPFMEAIGRLEVTKKRRPADRCLWANNRKPFTNRRALSAAVAAAYFDLPFSTSAPVGVLFSEHLTLRSNPMGIVLNKADDSNLLLAIRELNSRMAKERKKALLTQLGSKLRALYREQPWRFSGNSRRRAFSRGAFEAGRELAFARTASKTHFVSFSCETHWKNRSPFLIASISLKDAVKFAKKKTGTKTRTAGWLLALRVRDESVNSSAEVTRDLGSRAWLWEHDSATISRSRASIAKVLPAAEDELMDLWFLSPITGNMGQRELKKPLRPNHT